MSTSPVPTTFARTGVLASDAEREHTVQQLHTALAEGRLGLDETDERVTAAYATRHREELSPLVADLPGATPPQHPAPDGPAWSSIWESLVWRAHLIVLGPRTGRPTAAHCRHAVWFAAAAVIWFLLCAVLGALVVGA